jgi:cell division transport system ATP-binding protein
VAQIEFKKVTKEYIKDIKVLNEVSFSIEKGEFVFVIGPSGAGKSTIIKLLLKEELPDSGNIIFEGVNVSEITPDEMPEYRRKIGVVFQDYRLLNSKTVYDNVAIALEVVDSDEQDIKSIVPNVLSLVGLLDHSSYYPEQLSGGEKQRVAIARALAHEPDILIADEATGMIDPDSADGIIELLEKINSLGTTVIMSTHDQRIVDKMTKRVIKIENGKIVSDKKGGKYRA